jgi:hypothetical protein
MSDYFYSPEICEVVELTGVAPALHGFTHSDSIVSSIRKHLKTGANPYRVAQVWRGSQVGPEVAGHDRPLPGNAISILANLLVYPVGDTLTQCDPFGIPSTSHWTGAAIIRSTSINR